MAARDRSSRPSRTDTHRDGIEPSRTPGSTSLDAALAIAGVSGGATDDVRQALSARVASIRREMSWASSSPLARDVIDQFALASAHVEVVRACAAVFEEEGAQDSTSDGADTEDPMVVMFERLAEACGQTLPAETEVDVGRSRDARNRRAWERRLSRAEGGLRRAARLVRHARKAGWISQETLASARAESDSRENVLSVTPGGHTPVDREDPLAPLTAPAPEPTPRPLRGEAAVVAAETRARIDAMREAWPPPERIRWTEFGEPDCPWNPFDYEVECDAAGHPVDEGRWAVLVEEPETPDELLADLAEWAPDYAVQ